jgi:flagellar hook protein FlgE
MGLASALTTALTGLTAAESQIDIAGNNLANSQTVGYKSSDVVFVTQFLQTQSLGSSPSGTDGGTNPRQTGLGVRVGEITPDFTQGTIEVSSNPSDLAIQGDGFFIVQGSSGERLYTRNGIFKTNANNQLVTTTGNLVLGTGVDQNFNIDPSTGLVPVEIPLGSKTVAKATQHVTLEGTLTPTGDVADTASVIESAILGDASIPRPDITGATAIAATPPDISGVTVAHSEGPGTLAEGSVYQYKMVYLDTSGQETGASSSLTVTVPAGDTLANNRITLNNLPAGSADYPNVRIYRATGTSSTATFQEVGTAAAGGSFNDDLAVLPGTPATLNNSGLTGNYSYLVTFYDSASQTESRPSTQMGPVTVVNGHIELKNLPNIPSGTTYDKVRVYRNVASNSNSYFLVGTVDAPGGTPNTFTDGRSDASISDLTVTGNKAVDLDGPRIGFSTRLVDVVKRDGLNFENVFKEGKLSFQARKGGRQLAAKEFSIDATTTVEQLLSFMNNAAGIQTQADDPTHDFPGSLNKIPGETGTLSAGAAVTADGKIRFVSNNGVDNALEIGISGFKITTADNSTTTSNLGFGTIQTAKGQSAVADFVAYDSLGMPINVRVTAVLQSISGTQSTYRWFADSPQNDTAGNPDVDISVGTGLISFDGEGNLIGTTNNTVSISRRDVPSADPLEFSLDFGSVSGLSASKSSLAATRQDGSAEGKLTSYIIGEDGTIRGVFSNGVSRDLGQIQLARFANSAGLQQVGQSMYAEGVNSGLPVIGDPNEKGLGKIVSGARELSNTDIGKNMIELVLASTQYRGNSRVISTAQQLLDELLNLRR